MNNRKRQQRRAADMMIRSKSRGRYGLNNLSEMLGNLAETFAPLVTALSDFTQRMSRAARAFYEEDARRQCAGWIRVDDRMPTNGERVLTVDSEGVMAVYYYDAEWPNAFCGYSGLLKVYNVTHWMPLPEPPESLTLSNIID